MSLLLFYAALTAICWAALVPMLRDRTYVLAAPEPLDLSVPDLTFDPRGFT